MPELIVMLTQNDRTVPNAPEVFEACADSRAKLWGFKEEGLPLPEMKRLYARMKDCGKQTALEVVCYSEAEGLAGAKMAAACGCDLLMGTMYSKEISRLCADHGIRYLPFVGRITGRPSVLEGSLTEMLDQAREALEGGGTAASVRHCRPAKGQDIFHGLKIILAISQAFRNSPVIKHDCNVTVIRHEVRLTIVYAYRRSRRDNVIVKLVVK